MNETKNEIKIDTLTTETENALGQILQKNKIAYIGTNDQPKYVVMTYDHYQRFPGHPTGPLMEMAKTEQGVWVAIEDLIAYRFNEYGTTRSQQRHIGKIQIKDDDLYLLEIIDDLPYGYMYPLDETNFGYLKGIDTITLRTPIGIETVNISDGIFGQSEISDSILKSHGTSWEEYRKQNWEMLPRLNIILKYPRD